MSTLEKTITLLQEMPEQSLESLYDFIQSIWIRRDAIVEHPEKTGDTSKSMAGFQVLQSFAGTLPADFDYKKELEEMRDEKYRRFN
ncbi:MAG: hypothetical protein NC392_12750 [Roseburia sp.]|nr:hypothetical protein [Roseburia sp.]